MLQNYEVWIVNDRDIKPYPRNAPVIIEALREHNLLHSGFLVEIRNLEITSTQAVFSSSFTKEESVGIMGNGS